MYANSTSCNPCTRELVRLGDVFVLKEVYWSERLVSRRGFGFRSDGAFNLRVKSIAFEIDKGAIGAIFRSGMIHELPKQTEY